MKFAAIDIGTNAVRLLIEEVINVKGHVDIQKVSFTRVPLRLGADVFKYGRIPHKKSVQLAKTMKAFWHLMDVHGIQQYRACATSAMREAENGQEVAELVLRSSNVKIEVISGQEEADLIFGNYLVQNLDKEKSYLFIDVGGGSTEVSLIKKGERKRSKSFKIGAVRALSKESKKENWKEAKEWLSEISKKEKGLIAIGTGGNINRLFKMSRRKMFEPISLGELTEIYEYLGAFSVEERIVKLRLKPDRADVIVPAADIYIKMMKYAGVEDMLVPKLGLSDGIILQLYNKWQ